MVPSDQVSILWGQSLFGFTFAHHRAMAAEQRNQQPYPIFLSNPQLWNWVHNFFTKFVWKRLSFGNLGVWNCLSFSNVFQLGTLASKLQAQEVSWRCCLLNPGCYQRKLLVAELRTSFLKKEVHGKGCSCLGASCCHLLYLSVCACTLWSVGLLFVLLWMGNPVPEEFKSSSSSAKTKFLSCRGVSYGYAIFLVTPWQHHWIIFVPSETRLTTTFN